MKPFFAPTSSSSRSTPTVYTFTHNWTIDNLSTWFYGPSKTLYSAPFALPAKSDCQFRLAMKYAGKKKANPSGCGGHEFDVYLEFCSKKNWFSRTKFGVQTGVMDTHGVVQWSEDFSINVSRLCQRKYLGTYFYISTGKKHSVTMANGPNLSLPFSDSWTIQCKIIHVASVKTTEAKRNVGRFGQRL